LVKGTTGLFFRRSLLHQSFDSAFDHGSLGFEADLRRASATAIGAEVKLKMKFRNKEYARLVTELNRAT
jgi:predicted thioesterase